MSDPISTKKTLHGHATPQVSELLGMNNTENHGHEDHGTSHAKTSPGPTNLPVVDASLAHATNHEADTASHILSAHAEPETLEEVQSHESTAKKVLRAFGPYVAVFAVGLVLYYFFLSKTDFSNIFDKIKPAPKTVSSPKETALQTLEKQNLSAYQAWISQYYFDVSDTTITDPNTDNSGNGLSNFQKFLLGLNPRAYDTLGLGAPDSQTLSSGINPLTGSALNEKQKQIVDKYFDLEVIMNRLAISNLNKPKVAGESTTNTGINQNTYNPGSGQAGSLNARGGQNSGVSIVPNTGANLTPQNFDGSDIDQTKPGLLEIPSLKISVPLVWTQDPKNFDIDLQTGVVHYPGTALPGQVGTAYISGHSSNYAWAKGSYNRIFSKLGDLADNSSFTITVYTKTGKTIKYHYVVTHRAEYKATDQAQFQNAGVPTVALSTCWPVNTTQKRLVVFGEQTQVEQ